jgi:hypothetical protein
MTRKKDSEFFFYMGRRDNPTEAILCEPVALDDVEAARLRGAQIEASNPQLFTIVGKRWAVKASPTTR